MLCGDVEMSNKWLSLAIVVLGSVAYVMPAAAQSCAEARQVLITDIRDGVSATAEKRAIVLELLQESVEQEQAGNNAKCVDKVKMIRTELGMT